MSTTNSSSSPEKFASFCGFDFDPSKKSDCSEICKGENPEEFKRCEEHFKTKPVEKKVNKKSKGKSKWGHVNGTQAGLIDDCISTAKKLLTLEEIKEFSGSATNYRTLHHLKHLVNDKNVDIQLNKDGKIFWIDGKVKAKGVGSITTFSLKKKSKKSDKKEKKEENKKEKK